MIRRFSGTPAVFVVGLLFCIPAFAVPRLASAAFGISPPFMNVSSLVRGSRYVQTIYLVQDQPNQDLTIQAKLDVPQSIRSWFTILPGEQFVIPKGVRQFAVSVAVQVPQETDLGYYKGALTFTTVPGSAGQVTIALGAQVNINLTVGTDIVRKMSLALLKPLDIEEGWAPRAYVKFNNEGNVAEYLDGGTFEVYDQFGAARLAYIQKGKEGLPEIPAFTIKDFTIEFPTDFYLGVGQYWASINLVQEGKSVGTQRTVFNVLTKGSLSTPLERFLLDLKANWQRSLGIGVIVFAALIAIWRFVRRRKQ